MRDRWLTRALLPALRQCAGRWKRSIHGGVAVTFAMSLPLVLALVGVASDYAMMKKLQAELQQAADAAAMAGAREIPLAKSNPAQVVSAARTFAAYQLTGNSSASSEMLLTKGLSLSTSVNDDFTSVAVTISEVWTPFFMHFVKQGVTPVTVTSKARFVGRNNICVLGLSAAGTGVHLKDDSRLTGNNCGVFANSTSSRALKAESGVTLNAAIVCASGGVDVDSKAQVLPSPLTDCPTVEDPLASRAGPVVGSCDYTATVLKDVAVTLDPGTYCGGIEISGTSRVTLMPGTYVLKDGGLKVRDTAELTGDGVGFYITGDAKLVEFTADTSISLEAQVDGPMAGLLIAEDRTLTTSLEHRIKSNNARKLLGTIYLPVGKLLIDARKPVADLSAYTAIVAQSLKLAAGPNLILNSNYTTSDVPVPEGIAGSYQVVLQD